MILTDRAKELFEDHFIEEYNNNQATYLNLGYGMSIVEGFYSIPLCMQFEAYADWFEAKGIKLEIFCTEKETYIYRINGKASINEFGTRAEAREQVLVQANRLYNKTEKEVKA